jgi:hypothetical protein
LRPALDRLLMHRPDNFSIFHWWTVTSLATLLDAIDKAYCLAAKAGEKDAARLLLMASLAISQKIETVGEPQALQTAE